MSSDLRSLQPIGSLAALHDLRAALTLWRLAEAACEADWTNLQAVRDADHCWLEVGSHALNCGATGEEPSLLEWVQARANSINRGHQADQSFHRGN